MSRAVSIEMKAEEVAAQADEAASLCLSLPSLARDGCLVAAGVAREATQAVAEEAHDAAVQAADGYLEANAAKMAIDGLLGHCGSLEDWQESAYQDLLSEASYWSAKAEEADCGSFVGEVEAAEDSLEEALAAAGEAPPSDFG
jgi:hypothetical protein